MNSSSSTINLVSSSVEITGLFNSLTLESTKTANIAVLVLNIVLVIVSVGIYLYSKNYNKDLNKGLAVLLFFILLFNLVWAIANSVLLSKYNNDDIMIYYAEQDPSSKNLCIANVAYSWFLVIGLALAIRMLNNEKISLSTRKRMGTDDEEGL